MANTHAVPTTTVFPPTHPLIPTDTIEEAEPLLSQSVTFMIPPMTPPDQQPTNSIITSFRFPDNWSQMSRRAKKSWVQTHKSPQPS